MNRRQFLKQASTALASASTGAAVLSSTLSCRGAESGAAPPRKLTILYDPDDAIAHSPQVQWAVGQLKASLDRRRVPVQVVNDLPNVPKSAICILAAGKDQRLAREVLAHSHLRLPSLAESLALASGKAGGRKVSLACGSDARGLTYALLELADQVNYASEPLHGMASLEPVVERPANCVRSNMRLFASDVEDKAWFYDREFWERYLTLLATERFNRFNLALGLGYDFPSGIRDAYFHFAYPFLVKVAGYDVRVTSFSEPERERNLEMLHFISEETAARGLDFQLGLWTHAYRWIDSPNANHVIEGLTPNNHAAYCRDALAALLTSCPAISGVTFRVHGESGVAEGSYEFWKTVFQGLNRCGRRVGLDMHAKGIDAEMIDVALSTGLPVTISPKFWAEHMGLPYHQAGIRPTEMPPPGRKDQGFFSKSSGSRSFLRYGYGDLLTEDRRYQVLHRIWPGTQRLLLWGDPAFARGYARAASFCGSVGMEVFEPLSFKGRKGSGFPGGRDAYADTSLKPAEGDFQKYSYGHRLWGRLLYNPNAQPETWRRLLKGQYGRAADSVEAALSNASRILPLITTAHTPSAANNNYWPEMYTNMSIGDANGKHPYGDTPSPKRFGTVSPLDPQLFSRPDDFADDLLHNTATGRYSPLDVADWLLSLAHAAEASMQAAQREHDRDAAFVRVAADVAIQVNIGRFFAHKFRAAVYYALQQRTGYEPLLARALAAYWAARQAWGQIPVQVGDVYVPDITFGPDSQLRGHWRDRLPAIDEDIRLMQEISPGPPPGLPTAPLTKEALDQILRGLSAKAGALDVPAKHEPVPQFRRGQAVSIKLSIAGNLTARRVISVRMLYRHITQAERFMDSAMEHRGGSFRALIPASYTDSPYPIQYYFEITGREGQVRPYPGLGPDLDQQPYYVIRQS